MMFYTQLFTSKRESLVKIWLAAHWERKITKAYVFDCNLESTIEEIVSTKMKIGLRTSGHLLMGVVRIYYRKAKYLLADCNEARVKIQVSFRPGQTNLSVEGLEADIQSITLIEDFTDFDSQLPPPNKIGTVDHFSLNQCRTEEITLKEDLGNAFLKLVDFGDEIPCRRRGVLDMQFVPQCDSFGDENTEYDVLDDTTTDLMAAHRDAISETTLLVNEAEGFVLEPVAVTPTTERKRGKRKRRLVVDHITELSNKDMREQLVDPSDLLSPPEMAPPTSQLMQWKENGGAHRLLGHDGAAKERDPELMRKDKQEVQGDQSIFSTDAMGLDDEQTYPEITMENAEHTLNYAKSWSETTRVQENDVLENSSLPLPSEEDSMVVHPTWLGANGSQSDSAVHTQSMLDSQEGEEEKRMTKRTQRTDTFRLRALCEGGTRSQVAVNFFCLLALNKEEALDLHQSAPYGDITATPGPRFHHL
ncbi:hypothetical protein NHX12_012580 [Muraenolepis orangiensis]|uniref:Rad21/Rec8-like protein N-terminal domain-containing protein n=1 Tax=Muraenolepis orangiensis TaxID=630683 RepID=A0A9Q0I510_9TELE|nr:hypothetical protein NHX12_012580 [Muraenolepis orangiensis]